MSLRRRSGSGLDAYCAFYADVPHAALVGRPYEAGSLEDGKRYQTLKKHLARRGLTPADYRAKWGLPHDYLMVTVAYSQARSAIAKETGFGNGREERARPADGAS